MIMCTFKSDAEIFEYNRANNHRPVDGGDDSGGVVRRVVDSNLCCCLKNPNIWSENLRRVRRNHSVRILIFALLVLIIGVMIVVCARPRYDDSCTINDTHAQQWTTRRVT
jgi:hypothetical protein